MVAPLPKQILIERHGTYQDAVSIKSYDVPTPKPNEVLARLIASPIHPSDFGIIQGTYGFLPELPAVGGREGIGEIIALGEGIDPSLIGTQVRMPSPGAWQEVCVISVDTLIPIPDDLPIDSAAMAFINPPTAWHLLHGFISLKPGDWIVQNAANSAVGFCVIQLAKHLGYRTLNVVRNPDWETQLKAIGADVVATEKSDWHKNIKALTNNAPPKLALNSIGGQSAINLIKALEQEGTLVTFGSMVGNKVHFPTRDLIFKNITLKGFWCDKWLKTHPQAEVQALFQQIFKLIKEGIFNIPIEKKYPLDQAMEALAEAQKPGRHGKILFQSHWWPSAIA